MAIDPSQIWLIVGAICLAIEALGIPGIGFLFAGLAAILTGLLVHLNVVDAANNGIQIAVFFATTTLLAVVLWKKLKSWRTNPASAGDYRNMIGDVAIVGQDGLARGKVGQVSWSGTTMMAELSEQSGTISVAQGDAVEIVEIKGNRLIVAPKRMNG